MYIYLLSSTVYMLLKFCFFTTMHWNCTTNQKAEVGAFVTLK